MELGQWIAVYGAISEWAASRERNAWAVFSGGLISCCLLLAVTAYIILRTPTPLQDILSMGATSLGWLVASVWAAVYRRLSLETQHWNRLLRSIESQFAGAELHRSLHRLAQGDQVCVPEAAWICNGWNPQPARFDWVARKLTPSIGALIPTIFALLFVALLVHVCLT